MSDALTLHPDRPDLSRAIADVPRVPVICLMADRTRVRSAAAAAQLMAVTAGNAEPGYPVSGDLLTLVRAGVRTVGPRDG